MKVTDAMLFVCASETFSRTLCADCVKTEGVDLGRDDVATFHYFQDGFTGAPICDGCALAIPVYVDGNSTPEEPK